MTPTSWRPGCPVTLDDLRLVSLTYIGFDGAAHRGTLVVNRDATSAIVGAFRRLYAARFPIRRMVPVDAYGGSDFRSIEADNTSSVQLPARDGIDALVEPRVRPRDRRQPDREPVHLGRQDIASRERPRT